jgi:hypothetical protein
MHKREYSLVNEIHQLTIPDRWTRQVSKRRQTAERWTKQICPHPGAWRFTEPKPDLNSLLAELFFQTRSFSSDTSLPTGSFSYRITLWIILTPTRYEFSILFTSDFYLKNVYKGLSTRIYVFLIGKFGVTIGMTVVMAPITHKLVRTRALKQ